MLGLFKSKYNTIVNHLIVKTIMDMNLIIIANFVYFTGCMIVTYFMF